MQIKYYLPNPVIYHIRHLGFHYSIDAENYIMIFPILKYKGRPTLFCKLVYNILDNTLVYDIMKSNKEPLALYYDREFGNAEDYIKKIDSIVNRRIRTMGFKKKMKRANNKQKTKGEKGLMNGTNIFNGMFGKIEAGLVRLDVHGNVAVRTTNGYKSYSTKSKRLINCDSFVFDIGEEFFFVIPTNKVEVNDIILATGKNGKRVPKCVIEVNDTYITVINYEDSVVENILPERHVFMGSTYFYGKIVSMFNFNKGKKNGGFENILKFKMISEMMGNGSGNNQNNMMGNMMMLSMMNNGGLDNMFNFDNMFSLGETEESEEENK